MTRAFELLVFVWLFIVATGHTFAQQSSTETTSHATTPVVQPITIVGVACGDLNHTTCASMPGCEWREIFDTSAVSLSESVENILSRTSSVGNGASGVVSSDERASTTILLQPTSTSTTSAPRHPTAVLVPTAPTTLTVTVTTATTTTTASPTTTRAATSFTIIPPPAASRKRDVQDDLSAEPAQPGSCVRSLVVESSSNADASDDIDIAVGGIVGGVIVLFLVAGLIAVAVVVHRAKRNRNDVMGTTSAIVRQASFQTKEGNHGRIDLPTNNHYGSRLVERPVNHNHYDVLKPSEVGNG